MTFRTFVMLALGVLAGCQMARCLPGCSAPAEPVEQRPDAPIEAASDAGTEATVPAGNFGDPCVDWWDCEALSAVHMQAGFGATVLCAADPQGARYCSFSCFAPTPAGVDARRLLCKSYGVEGCTTQHPCGWPL